MQFKPKFNLHGIIGLILIIAMFAVALFRQWDIAWWYFVLAVIAYGAAIIGFTLLFENSPQMNPDQQFQLYRAVIGSHIAFAFLTVGLGVGIRGFLENTGLFLACVAAGIAIPFMLLRKP